GNCLVSAGQPQDTLLRVNEAQANVPMKFAGSFAPLHEAARKKRLDLALLRGRQEPTSTSRRTKGIRRSTGPLVRGPGRDGGAVAQLGRPGKGTQVSDGCARGSRGGRDRPGQGRRGGGDRNS